MFQMTGAAGEMSPLDQRGLSVIGSDHDNASAYPFYYNGDDCLLLGGNTTSASCINGTRFRDSHVPLADYYQYENEAGSNFFDVYYSSTRFAVETTMALLSMTLNVLVVIMIGRFSVTRRHTSVYNILFVD